VSGGGQYKLGVSLCHYSMVLLLPQVAIFAKAEKEKHEKGEVGTLFASSLNNTSIIIRKYSLLEVLGRGL